MVLGMALNDARRNALVSLITLLFFIPLVLFSMAGGFLADRVSKRSVTIGNKIIEIAAMALAIVALTTQQKADLAQVTELWQHPGLLFTHFPLALVVLFIVAIQAALFGPSKYGLLPELLPEKSLSWGNGIIELGTFLAIISGAMAAGWLAQVFATHEPRAGSVLVGLAVVGLLSSLSITNFPAAAPQKKFRANFVAELWEQIHQIRPYPPLCLAVLGNTYFWFLGPLFLQTVLVHRNDVLHLRPPPLVLLAPPLAH